VETDDVTPPGKKNEPVDMSPSAAEPPPASGLALCLSGGGYRAMVFHVGVLWRLDDAGLLGRLDRVSSVSGGSITAAWLALNWNRLAPTPGAPSPGFREQIVDPIRKVAGTTIDVGAVVGGLLLPWATAADRVAGRYRSLLFGDATLQDLPDAPLFVINATNLQSGVLWRFMKDAMRDWRVGEVKRPTIPLARAVAASSAFPPFLSPARLALDPNSFTPGSGDDLQREPYTRDAVLTDGGVYDNLGLETAWKRCRTILVSDAGAETPAEPAPKRDWLRHMLRVLNVVDRQVRSLRKRELIDAYKAGLRSGAYWGIRTDIADYQLPDPLPCPHARTLELAAVPTRLCRLDPTLQDRLINWGYAVCDAALRKHVAPELPRPHDFPYPSSGV